MHVEFRVRTVCELTLNEDYYLQPSVVSFCNSHTEISKNILLATSANYEQATQISTQHSSICPNPLKVCFQLDCCDTCKDGNYSNMWHVHGLATVLGQTIMSLYPDINARIKRAYHKEVVPRVTHNLEVREPCFILWTRAVPRPLDDKWQPNHFVPCVGSSGKSEGIPNTKRVCVCKSQQDAGDNSNEVEGTAVHKVHLSKHDKSPCRKPVGGTQFQCQQGKSPKPQASPHADTTTWLLSTARPTQSESPVTECTSNKPQFQCQQGKAPKPQTQLHTHTTTQLLSSQPIDRPTQSESPVTECKPVQVQCQQGKATKPQLPPHTHTTTQLLSSQPIDGPTCTQSESPVTECTSNKSVHVQCQQGKAPKPQSPPHAHTTTQLLSSQPVDRPTQSESSTMLTVTDKPNSTVPIVTDSWQCKNKILGVQLSLAQVPKKVKVPQAHSMHAYFSKQLGEDKHQLFSSNTSECSKPRPTQKAPTVLTVTGKSNSTASTSIESWQCTLNKNKILGVQLTLARVPSKVKVPQAQSIQAYFSKQRTEGKHQLEGDSLIETSHNAYDTMESADGGDGGQSEDGDDGGLSVDGGDGELSEDGDDGGLSADEGDGELSEYEGDGGLSEDGDDGDCIEIITERAQHSLPYPNLSPGWYKRQYSLSAKNASRVVQVDEENTCRESGTIQYINRSKLKGTLLEDNLKELKEKKKTAKDDKRLEHLTSLTKVGEYVLQNGSFVKTQEAGHIYSPRSRPSAELYNIFSKHLNLIQVYIFGVAYLLHCSPGTNVLRLLDTLKSVHEKEDVIVNRRVESRVKDTFLTALEYMDTHRDRQVLKSVVASITGVNFTTSLQGISSKQGTRNAKKKVNVDLVRYRDIKKTSQVVRNDLTTEQQHRLQKRIISARKVKEIRTIGEGRGRKLKSQHFPELSTILEYAFGEMDVNECGGGGLESHPRLTTGTLYRAVDNVTSMKRAREVLLSVAPQGFKICLSSCYNYTNNYRRGSLQAVRHHADRGVNANLSLKKPPRIGVPQLVINLHWSTANVNLLVDSTLPLSNSVVMSKDAKAIILADCSPVQRPGHSWSKKIVLPDHSWDQSRTNAITPMTFLILKPVISSLTSDQIESIDIPVSQSTTLQVTRSGQGVTLLNLSFYEPDDTFKCLNEIFLLLTVPALDPFFRDRSTKKLKKQLTFIVDNGPAEQPSSPMVQMCLPRLLHFLNLEKVTQVSFAEYHSKRNFVERVHAEENRVLSKHGPFSSTYVHANATVGSKEHKENLEAMASRIEGCISSGTFGSQQLLCYRGIKQEDYIFNDEKKMAAFLSLSEDAKNEYTPSSYAAQQGRLLTDLHFIWETPLDFTGSYLEDHQMLNNELLEDRVTSWRDKYTTVVYSVKSDISCNRYELQPLPDYIRWIKTGELHYLPMEEASIISKGPWTDIPGAFLSSKVLDLFFNIVSDPPDDIILQISLLAWVPPHEVREYQKMIDERLQSQIKSEVEKERWKNEAVYKSTKDELEVTCRKLGIPCTPSMPKHQLCSLIYQKQNKSEPPLTSTTLYSGNLLSVPHTLSAIGRLTIARLKVILRTHSLPFLGCKDDLIMRVFLLRQGHPGEACLKEKKQMMDLIAMAKELIMAQQLMSLTNHIYRVRTYTTHTSKVFVPMPSHVHGEESLVHLLNPLLEYIQKLSRDRLQLPLHLPAGNACASSDESNLKEQITQIGAIISVKWTADEVGDSGWRPAWYKAEVHSYCEESDIITLKYLLEPDDIYEDEITPLLLQNKVKLLSTPL